LLDEQLCRSGPEALFRKLLEIEGRGTHTKVNPFMRGSAHGGALQMLGTNQTTGQTVLLELLNGSEARELRCVQLVADDDSVHVIRITDGMTPEQFRSVFDSFGITHFKSGIAYASTEELAWVESLLGTLKSDNKLPWSANPGPITYGPSVVKFEVTSRYFRAIAKIGFHYFLTKMPQFRGDEPCFADIRRFLKTDACPVDECRRFIGYAPCHLERQLRAGAELNCWGHFLTAQSNYVQLAARVELFAGPGKRPLSYIVRLGQNPSRLDFNEAYGDFFEYFPKEQRTTFDGRVSPLAAITSAPGVYIPLLSSGLRFALR
jgi:hypothetical protein